MKRWESNRQNARPVRSKRREKRKSLRQFGLDVALAVWVASAARGRRGRKESEAAQSTRGTASPNMATRRSPPTERPPPGAPRRGQRRCWGAPQAQHSAAHHGGRSQSLCRPRYAPLIQRSRTRCRRYAIQIIQIVDKSPGHRTEALRSMSYIIRIIRSTPSRVDQMNSSSS